MASCQRTCERGKGAYLTEPKQTGTELGPGRKSLAMVPREPRQRFRNLSKLVLAPALVRASVEHDLTGRAAQLSFYFLLAIFPLLIFISAMLGTMFEGTGPDAPFGGGQGEEAFKSFMMDAIGKQMTKAGGLGISASVQREMLKMQGLK